MITLANLCKKLNVIDTHKSVEYSGYEVKYVLFNGDFAKSPQHRNIQYVKYVPVVKIKGESPVYGDLISEYHIPNKSSLTHNSIGYWKKFR